jgi:hypothetical protein
MSYYFELNDWEIDYYLLYTPYLKKTYYKSRDERLFGLSDI